MNNIKFRLRNKENNGWHIVSNVEIKEENKPAFNALSSRITTFMNVLVLLETIGICDVNDALKRITERVDKNEIEYDPQPEKKKGWLDKIFK
jgi:hypothetical protein